MCNLIQQQHKLSITKLNAQEVENELNKYLTTELCIGVHHRVLENIPKKVHVLTGLKSI